MICLLPQLNGNSDLLCTFVREGSCQSMTILSHDRS